MKLWDKLTALRYARRLYRPKGPKARAKSLIPYTPEVHDMATCEWANEGAWDQTGNGAPCNCNWPEKVATLLSQNAHAFRSTGRWALAERVRDELDHAAAQGLTRQELADNISALLDEEVKRHD